MASLIDTDILIDYLRAHDEAIRFVESSIAESYVSAITVAELYQGTREGEERARLAKTLSAFTILPLTPEIAEHGGLFSREFRKSHGCGLADCLIAATADLHDLDVQTLNKKHYPMIARVRVPYQKNRPDKSGN